MRMEKPLAKPGRQEKATSFTTHSPGSPGGGTLPFVFVGFSLNLTRMSAAVRGLAEPPNQFSCRHFGFPDFQHTPMISTTSTHPGIPHPGPPDISTQPEKFPAKSKEFPATLPPG